MKRNGYRPSHRNRWLLLKEGILSRELFLFWEYCLDQMLFDKRNPGYGTATVNFGEVLSIFGVKSLTSVRTWYNELINLGLVRVLDSGSHVLEIVNCERYIQGGNGQVGSYSEREYDQTTDMIKQSIGFCRQLSDDKNQSTDAKASVLLKSGDSKALSSFKVDLGSISKQVTRTMDDYKEIYLEGSYSLLLPEDMMWIDQSQYFESQNMLRVDDPANDRDIADVFFQGNMRKYNSHLQIKSV